MTDLTPEENLRLSALHHAVETTPHGAIAEEVTERAETYLAFLRGTTGTAATDVETAKQAARKDLVRVIVDDLDQHGLYPGAEHVRNQARLSGLLE